MPDDYVSDTNATGKQRHYGHLATAHRSVISTVGTPLFTTGRPRSVAVHHCIDET